MARGFVPYEKFNYRNQHELTKRQFLALPKKEQLKQARLIQKRFNINVQRIEAKGLGGHFLSQAYKTFKGGRISVFSNFKPEQLYNIYKIGRDMLQGRTATVGGIRSYLKEYKEYSKPLGIDVSDVVKEDSNGGYNFQDPELMRLFWKALDIIQDIKTYNYKYRDDFIALQDIANGRNGVQILKDIVSRYERGSGQERREVIQAIKNMNNNAGDFNDELL